MSTSVSAPLSCALGHRHCCCAVGHLGWQQLPAAPAAYGLALQRCRCLPLSHPRKRWERRSVQATPRSTSDASRHARRAERRSNAWSAICWRAKRYLRRLLFVALITISAPSPALLRHALRHDVSGAQVHGVRSAGPHHAHVSWRGGERAKVHGEKSFHACAGHAAKQQLRRPGVCSG